MTEETSPVRVALVGAGHLGKHHARLLKALPDAELVGICDVDEARAKEMAEQWEVPWSTRSEELPRDWGVEAVSLVVPTVFHAQLALPYLEEGLDLLVEKPLVPSVAEGEKLCALAEDKGLILQVGHVERYNPVLKAVRELGIKPRYIEGDRLAPFSFRSTDIGVVLDLMIHDIDILLSLLCESVEDVEAFGMGIFTPAEDIATARLRFEGGAIARLTANRVALKPARRMRMFSKDSYVSLDFGTSYGLIIQKAPGWDLQNLPVDVLRPENIQDLWKFVFEGLLTVKELSMDAGNPLEEELAEFVASVRSREQPTVDGRAGLEAVRVAEQVVESLAAHEW
jgi:predicted dehydrogenase